VLRCLSPGCVRLTGLGAFDRRPAPLLPKSKRAMAKILISHPARCAPTRERSANKFSSRNVCPLHKECVDGSVRDLCESNSTGRPLPPLCREMPLGSGSRSGEQPNAGAISCHFEQCEAEGILLAAKYSADQPFLVPRKPITPSVFDDFEVAQSKYRLRRKAGHARTTNPVTAVALSSTLIGSADAIRFRDASEQPPVNSS
jgi:hypothetical protein